MDGTSPVRTYPPNAWGLYDVAGNVWEWTADWYDKDYYASLPPDKPAEDPHGPDKGTAWRTLRGGSCYNYSAEVRAPVRGGNRPVNRDDNIGFRCARE